MRGRPAAFIGRFTNPFSLKGSKSLWETRLVAVALRKRKAISRKADRVDAAMLAAQRRALPEPASTEPRVTFPE